MAAVGRASGPVSVYDLQPMGARTRILPDAGACESLAVFAPNALAASGSRDGAIHLWDLATGAQLATLLGHDRSVSQLAFSPDGDFVYSAARDRTLRLWSLATGIGAVIPAPDADVRDLAVAATGRLAVVFRDGSVHATDAAQQLQPLLAAPSEPSRQTVAIAFNPANNHLTVVRRDGTVTLVPEDGAPLTTAATETHDLAWSPDGRQLALALKGGTVLLVVDGAETEFVAHADGVTRLAFRNNRELITGGRDGRIRFWHLSDLTAPLHEYLQHSNALIELPADGRWLLSSGRDRTTYASNLSIVSPTPARNRSPKQLADWYADRGQWPAVAVLTLRGTTPSDPMAQLCAAWQTNNLDTANWLLSSRQLGSTVHSELLRRAINANSAPPTTP